MFNMQTKFKRAITKKQSFKNSDLLLLPDRVFPLSKIMQQFLTGRPIDSSLQKNLPFNTIENNPLYQKGVDLCDLPHIAKEVNQTLEDVNSAVEKAKLAKANIAPPDQEPPTKVE